MSTTKPKADTKSGKTKTKKNSKNVASVTVPDRPSSTVGLKGKLGTSAMKQKKKKEEDVGKPGENYTDMLGGKPERTSTVSRQSSKSIADKQRTKETDPGDVSIQEENSSQLQKAQKLLQTNFLKAVMIDDPALREFAIARLQNV